MALGELTNQTAIVTGGASGIGLATANLLAECGARIVVADLDDRAGEECCARLRAEKGVEAIYVRTDVANLQDVDALIERTLQAFNTVEILMHFAGIGMERSALDTSPNDWNRLISTNLTGSFFVLQAAGRVMVRSGYGRIVAMSSIAGMRGGSGRVAYGASKGGVLAMMQVMALEWPPYGITVNALAPVAIETALVKKMHDDETRRAYLSGIPMNRYGTPEEVAAAAVLLSLPSASYVTGVTLPVDGGFASSGGIKSNQSR